MHTEETWLHYFKGESSHTAVASLLPGSRHAEREIVAIR